MVIALVMTIEIIILASIAYLLMSKMNDAWDRWLMRKHKYHIVFLRSILPMMIQLLISIILAIIVFITMVILRGGW